MATRGQTQWVAGQQQGGLVTVMRRDGARATVVDVGDGVVRVRVFELEDGAWARVQDATLEAFCDLDPIDPDDGGLLLLEAA